MHARKRRQAVAVPQLTAPDCDYGHAVGYIRALLDELLPQARLLLRGSYAYGAKAVPFWSDIDASVMLPRADAASLRQLRALYSRYRQRYPHIKLSLTIIDGGDDPQTNPLHHHGIKPIAYNYELQRQQEGVLRYHLSADAVRISSVYRYYEILYDFRKACMTGEITADLVARGFHRLARFVRTQLEILSPSLVEEMGKIDEREYAHELDAADLLRDFFIRYDMVKADWGRIRHDPVVLASLAQYLIELFDELHLRFLPRLRSLGQGYAYEDLR